jgi:hypothetical protein
MRRWLLRCGVIGGVRSWTCLFLPCCWTRVTADWRSSRAAAILRCALEPLPPGLPLYPAITADRAGLGASLGPVTCYNQQFHTVVNTDGEGDGRLSLQLVAEYGIW